MGEGKLPMMTRKERWVHYQNNFSFFRKIFLKLTIENVYHFRNYYANKYLQGNGYEIGALTSPVYFHDKHVSVKYVDYLTRLESAEKCNVPFEECVEVDIVADGNNLSQVASDSVDFVIANHVLEHSPDPIGSILEWLRIIKEEGTIFFSVPNYRCNEFDFIRKPVGLDHLVSDFKGNGHQDIETIHIEEHVEFIDGIAREKENEFNRRKKQIIQSNLHTHFHVFDGALILNLLKYVNQMTPIVVVDFFAHEPGFEHIYIVRKATVSERRFVVRHNIHFKIYILLKSFLKQFLNVR